MNDAMMEEELPPLKIKCTSTNCEEGLHCFKQKGRGRARTPSGGPCRACGADLVDFDRVHTRRPGDVQYTFEALRHEYIRHHFWHLDIDEAARLHALRKGRARLREAVGARLRSSVGRPASRNPREGRQTPFEGNVIFYAQHATASCCRACMEYWHDIPKEQDLTEAELAYLGSLVWKYIEARMPDLPEEPQKIPPRLRARVR